MSTADNPNERVALVTGGGRGIGRGIATALGARGWRVLVNYRADEKAAADCVRQIEESGGQARSIQADVNSSEGRATLLRESLAAWGGVDPPRQQRRYGPARTIPGDPRDILRRFGETRTP